MSTKMKNLRETAERLKTNYPQYESVQNGDSLEVRLPFGRIEVNGFHVSTFIFDELLDEEDIKSSDRLYAAIEEFIIFMQEDEQNCNSVYSGAVKTASGKLRTVVYTAAAVMTIMLLLCAVMELGPVSLLAALLIIPLLAVIPARIACGNVFKRNWVCPHCGARLPMDSKKLLPWAKAVSACPQCGTSLLDEELVQKMKEDFQSVEDGAFVFPQEIPERGGKKACRVCGILLLAFALLLGGSWFLTVSSPVQAMLITNAVTLLITAFTGLALLLCREKDTDNTITPKIIVCERKLVEVVGLIAEGLGLVLIFGALAVSSDEPVEPVLFAILTMFGLLNVLLGAWMCLARRNRALYIYSSSVTYVSSFGRKREIECAQISSVKIAVSGSIKFLNHEGKKLFSIENNMLGAISAIDWIDRQKFPVNIPKTFEKQVKDSEGQEVLSWNEEDRTPLHDHLKAIRAGLAVVMVLFAAGAIVPVLLYIYTDIKYKYEIYLACFSSLPMILYYLVFAPVLTPDYPEGATEEWKAMHVRFPVSCQGLISLFVAGSVYYFWESAILQIADTGRFMLLAAAVSAVLIALFYFRTPKRLRKEDGLGLIILSLFLVAISLTYGLNLAISEPARHYPAVVVEQNESESEDNGARTLTLLLDDGKEMELNVNDEVCDLVDAGVEFVVCQKENFLGIRMVRIHLAEGTDLSELLKQYGETP